ncbi:hypothetical protein HO133_001153 [Letharia lupina]|uniref:Uncharacterized protein n=1 Tax=Letharia lupina TaxID=560253 RepID=A0A8H6FB81_9LECA|nr:uncharacterized protein HO133_001153 [Letharia lupina]KAF6222067.1 hypothetical protein HO133_001153 [Letharia lupina]
MGQKQSKRVSSTSSASLLTTYISSPSSISSPSNPTSPTSPISPDTLLSEISIPAIPRQLTRISEILDPRDILREQTYLDSPSRIRSSSQPLTSPNAPKGGIVHSPSGNALGAEEFIAHPSRPLAMWERQERVLQATREGLERFEAEKWEQPKTRREAEGEGRGDGGFVDFDHDRRDRSGWAL